MKSESQILRKKTQFVLEVFTFKLSGVCINFFRYLFSKARNSQLMFLSGQVLEKSTNHLHLHHEAEGNQSKDYGEAIVTRKTEKAPVSISELHL